MSLSMPTVAPDEIGWLTEAQIIEVDRVMIDELRINLIQMMENAGRNLAQFVLDQFAPRTVTVLVGAGGNGGGGLVAARHLANRGVDVSVTLGQPVDKFTPAPAHQYEIVRLMGIALATTPRSSDVVVDALIGYSLSGAPRGRVGQLVATIADAGERIVALDTPSGLDVTDGSVPGLVVDADATLTLAMPKVGLRDAPPVGDLYVADISVPPSVYETIGVGPAPDFSRSSVIKILAS